MGKDVMQVCSVGCIGCMLCTKQCEYGAITVENNIAHIDQSKQRIPMIVNNARGFVYCVSQMGVTGNGANFHKQIREYLLEVKKNSPVPVMMGFGIRTAGDVEPLEDIIDGAIVGSHFITLMKENNYDENVIKEYISSFKKEMNE